MEATMEAFVSDDKWDGENHPNVFIDFLNQEVRVGDHVVYAITSGRSPFLVVGVVEDFVTASAKGEPFQSVTYEYSPWEPGKPREVVGSNTHHYWKFRIRPLLESRGYFSRGRGKDGKVNTVVIATVHNVIKVNTTFADMEDDA